MPHVVELDHNQIKPDILAVVIGLKGIKEISNCQWFLKSKKMDAKRTSGKDGQTIHSSFEFGVKESLRSSLNMFPLG